MRLGAAVTLTKTVTLINQGLQHNGLNQTGAGLVITAATERGAVIQVAHFPAENFLAHH